MRFNFDPLKVIESAYATPGSGEAWTRGIADAFAPLARGMPLMVVDLSLAGWRLRLRAGATVGTPREVIDQHAAIWEAAPPATIRGWFHPTPPVYTMRGRLLRGDAPLEGSPVEGLRAAGIEDVLNVMGQDPCGNAVFVSILSPRLLRLSPWLAHRLSLVAAHLSAASRLRALVDPADEAVLDPSGNVEHAVGEARTAAARASLAAAVRRSEKARGRLRREEPDEALALWRALVEGRWSLVDHVEADGRRVLLARRNPLGVRDPRALSARERDVLAHVALGHGNKHVAYALGLSSTTVATHLARALAKLGLRTRRDAIGLFEASVSAGRPRTPEGNG